VDLYDKNDKIIIIIIIIITTPIIIIIIIIIIIVIVIIIILAFSPTLIKCAGGNQILLFVKVTSQHFNSL